MKFCLTLLTIITFVAESFSYADIIEEKIANSPFSPEIHGAAPSDQSLARMKNLGEELSKLDSHLTLREVSKIVSKVHITKDDLEKAYATFPPSRQKALREQAARLAKENPNTPVSELQIAALAGQQTACPVCVIIGLGVVGFFALATIAGNVQQLRCDNGNRESCSR